MKAACLTLVISSILVQGLCQDALYEGPLPVVQRIAEPFSTTLSAHDLADMQKKLLHANNLFHGLNTSLSLFELAKGNKTTTLHFNSEKKPLQTSASGLLGLNSQCVADTTAFVSQLANIGAASLWALQMADASGKPSAGIVNGRLQFLGDFDECRRVVGNYTPNTQQLNRVDGFAYDLRVSERKFHGQYCTGKYRINIKGFPPEGNNYIWGVCVPDSCNDTDAVYLANMALSYYNLSSVIQFEGMLCHERNVPWSLRAVVVLIIVIVMASIVVVATLVDGLFVRWLWVKQREEFAISIGSDGANQSSQGGATDDSRETPEYVHWRDDLPIILNGNPETAARSIREKALEESRPRLPLRIILAFSAITNTEKLLATKPSKDSLSCVNGIRVMSINWVVLGHTALCLTYFGDNLLAYYQTAIRRWTFQAILNGTFSVDSFFVLSGLLVSYLTLNELRRTGGRLNWLLFYVHRYLRLTPVYMMVLGIWICLLPYFLDGPLFPQKTGYEKDFCKHTWWGNLLYVQNLIKFKNGYCFGWGWYLAVDMQFYVLSPLMIVPLYLRPKLGFFISALFFLTTIVTPFALTEARYYSPGSFGIKGHPKALGDQNYDLYVSPYCRMGPYVTGILTGYLLYMYKTRCERIIRLSWPIATAGWIVATSTALAVLYGLSHHYKDNVPMNLHEAAFYNAFSRPAWGLSVAWVIYTCVTGWAGPINRFLSWPGWQPLARLTYTVYLVHFIVLASVLSTARTLLYVDDLTIVIIYLAALMGSYSVAYVISIIFEAPFMALEKVLLKKDKVN